MLTTYRKGYSKNGLFGRRPIKRKRTVKAASGSAVTGLTPEMLTVFNKMIAEKVSKMAENKYTQYGWGIRYGYGSDSANFYGASGGTIALTPETSGLTIPQGTGQGSRVGNRVRVKKAVLKCLVQAYKYDATYNPYPQPVCVQIFLWRPKGDDSLTNARAITQYYTGGTFFQQAATSIGFVGSYYDWQNEPNHDKLILYKKSMYKVGFSDNIGSGGVVASQYFTNSDFKYAHLIEIDITKMYPAVVTFNDATTTATSHGVYMTIAGFDAAGSDPGANRILFTYEPQVNLTYEDI